MAKQVLNEPIDVIENKIHKLSPDLLSILLKDNSTGENLYWATSTYEKYGDLYAKDKQMLPELMIGPNIDLLTPRVSKTQEEQQARTKDKGEVFTPAWMCNKQINYIDEDWFGRDNVFNFEIEEGWRTNNNKIAYSNETGKTWEEYVTNLRIEITCGEAPYLVSRYDVVKGEIIPVESRIGILDRKLRVINENIDDEKEWIEWAIKAYQCTYGYDYQGDNVLIARENLLYTLIDNMIYKFNHQPNLKILKRFSKIISWNIWQMDGLNCIVPHSSRIKEDLQIRLFDFEDEEQEREPIEVFIKNWKTGKNIKFKDLKGSNKSMKFDYLIGNPPYQKSTDTYNRQDPVYYYFYDSAEEIADKYCLITPARFLYNAGLTPKEWNQKMLSDKHLKVMFHEPDSSKVFSNTDIKAGVAVVYRDKYADFGAIKSYSQNKDIANLIKRFDSSETKNMTHIMYGGRSDLKFNTKFISDYPESIALRLKSIQKKHPEVNKLGPNEEFELKSSTLEVLSSCFEEKEPSQSSDFYKILGLIKSKRVYRWISKEYMDFRYPERNNVEKYKVFIPKAIGSGSFGEIISDPVLAGPSESCTSTFIGIGSFDTQIEAENLIKYIKTKLFRALLSILKVTQDVTPKKFSYVPIQDFTDNSDIDWSKSIKEIDQQLYKKYDLSQDEIEFIETHVKEME